MHLSAVETIKTESKPRSAKQSRKSPIARVIWTISLVLLVWTLVEGYSFYSMPYPERPHHPDYRVFRPAGTTGLLLGYAGAAMMVLMLVYSVRKRTRLLGQSISLQSLLRFHIYLGIMGPLLIVLHTSFKVQGLVAVSFWSMVAVAASGFFGRYLYLQIPRNIEGSELTLQDLGRVTDGMTETLRSRFRLDDGAIARLEEVTTRFVDGYRGGAFRSVFRLLIDDLFRALVRRRFTHEVRMALPLPRTVVREFARLAFQRAMLQRRVTLLAQVQQIFHYWHVIHKPFAIIMYLIMLVHIGVAIWTGYGWVW